MNHFLIVANNYTGTLNVLNGCENDADFYNSIALKDSANSVSVLKYTSRKIVADKLKDYAKICKQEDCFYFIFSGHGTQLPSQNEADFKTESLVLCDENRTFDFFRDFELSGFLHGIKCRKVIVLDCCFSGGMNKAFVPLFNNLYKRKYCSFDEIVGNKNEKSVSKSIFINYPKSIKNSVYMLACSENEFAIDLGVNGAFTMGLKNAYNENISFLEKSHEAFLKSENFCLKYQHPQYIVME